MPAVNIYKYSTTAVDPGGWSLELSYMVIVYCNVNLCGTKGGILKDITNLLVKFLSNPTCISRTRIRNNKRASGTSLRVYDNNIMPDSKQCGPRARSAPSASLWPARQLKNQR